jgi:hypothetical protein
MTVSLADGVTHDFYHILHQAAPFAFVRFRGKAGIGRSYCLAWSEAIDP